MVCLLPALERILCVACLLKWMQYLLVRTLFTVYLLLVLREPLLWLCLCVRRARLCVVYLLLVRTGILCLVCLLLARVGTVCVVCLLLAKEGPRCVVSLPLAKGGTLCQCVSGASLCIVCLPLARAGTLCVVCLLLVKGGAMCVGSLPLARRRNLCAVCQYVSGLTPLLRLCGLEIMLTLMLMLMLMLTLLLMLMRMLTLMLMLMPMPMLMLMCVRKPLGPRRGGLWVGCLPSLLRVLFMVGQSLAHMLSLCRLAGPPPVWGLV